MGKYPFDEPFDSDNVEEGGNQIHTIIKALNEGDPSGLTWTPRRIGLFQAMGGVSFKHTGIGNWLTRRVVSSNACRYRELCRRVSFLSELQREPALTHTLIFEVERSCLEFLCI